MNNEDDYVEDDEEKEDEEDEEEDDNSGETNVDGFKPKKTAKSSTQKNNPKKIKKPPQKNEGFTNYTTGVASSFGGDYLLLNH
jgi:hypothetical protein